MFEKYHSVQCLAQFLNTAVFSTPTQTQFCCRPYKPLSLLRAFQRLFAFVYGNELVLSAPSKNELNRNKSHVPYRR
jgi:hypothetical protein